MDLQIVDPIAWVRKNQIRFFSSGRIDPMRLLAYVMADVLELGGGECRILAQDDWWFVASDVDWLQHPKLSVKELFGKVVPAPDHGEHSLRAEILLTTFAQDVVTGTRQEEILVVGVPPNRDALKSAMNGERFCRLVGFRLGAQ